MKMASLVLLIPCDRPDRHRDRSVLPAGTGSVANPGAHGFLDPVRVLLGRQQQRQRICRHLGQHALL
jgi:hypothetical protein